MAVEVIGMADVDRGVGGGDVVVWAGLPTSAEAVMVITTGMRLDCKSYSRYSWR